MKTKFFVGLATGILLVGAAGLAQAAAVQWSGNNNWYEVVSVTSDITWEQANTAANAMTYVDGSNTLTGHLVTLTSAAENTFVFDTVLGSGTRDYTYWLGAYQYGAGDPAVQTKEDEITNNDQLNYWHWVTGETWNYTNWSTATSLGPEPNESYWSWDNERYLNYYKYDDSGGWNDLGNEEADTYDITNPARYSLGTSGVTCYIVEYEAPVPIPTTILLFGSGLVGLAGMRSRKRKK